MSLQHILTHKIIAIIRGGMSEEDLLSRVTALYDGGIRTVEVTVNSPKALKLIEAMADAMAGKMLIGAGTVLDAETARAAILAGAQFIVSPTFDPGAITMTKKYGAVSIPGGMTPTEILGAYTAGGDIIKVFPAGVGASFFREMRGPLPHIPLMPTGGVNTDNIGEYQKAGAVAFGLGSALTDTSIPVSDAYLQSLRDKAQQFIQAITPVS